MGGVNEDAGVLGGNDRFDDRSQIINIWQSFDTKQDVVESGFAARSILGCSNNYYGLADSSSIEDNREQYSPCLGLNRSLPNILDLRLN